MLANGQSRIARRASCRRLPLVAAHAIYSRMGLLLAVLCLAAPPTAQTQTPTSVTADMVAASARLAATLADYSLRDALKRIAEQQATLTALKKSLADCRGATGRTSCGKSTETDIQQKIDEVSKLLDALDAEQNELEAVAAAMKRFAESVQLSRQVAEILNGRSTQLAAALGLTSATSTIDASLAVDPRVQRLVFRTGRLTHCFSTRSVCDAKPYSVSR